MNPESHYIPRKLSWTDEEQKTRFIGDDALLAEFQRPLVILGDPGMGKTRLMERLGGSNDCNFIRATRFLRQSDNSIPKDVRLVIDGLDEVAAMEEGDPLHNVLKKLSACGGPPFVISCRSAEWRGVTARLDIAEDYDEAPQQLHLEALSEEEAVDVLALEVDRHKAEQAIHDLNQAGLGSLFQNPLTLEFVTAIVQADGNVPETKAELYERAVVWLQRESSPHHSDSTLGKLSDDEALDAAGATMAAMLITGKDGITRVPADEDALYLSDISDLANFETIEAILGSKLFRADTSDATRRNRFMPLHRTVAEFLGARWLAREVEKKGNPDRVARRLIGLISAEGGVAASLRGLHAWLPKFSPERLGPKAIDRDPYGVLRYGDSDAISTLQAKQIIKGLRQLATFDPFFRDDWWHDIALKGLAHSSLVEEIRGIICDSNEPMHLRSLLLEAVNGSQIAVALKPALEAIMLDVSRSDYERYEAGQAICRIRGDTFDWLAALERLVQMGDEDSTLLATKLIPEIGTEMVGDKLIARAIVANAGILNEQAETSRQPAYGALSVLARKIPVDRVGQLLDELTAIVLPARDLEKWPDIDYHGYDDGWVKISDFAEHLIPRQLECDAASVEPKQLWNWMRTLCSQSDNLNQGRKAVSNSLRENDRLRLGVQRLALFAPGTEKEFFLRNRDLEQFYDALAVKDDDARIHLSEVVSRGALADRERWLELVRQFRRTDGLIPKDIQNLARPFAVGDKELIDFLTKKPKPLKLSEWDKKHRRRIRDQKRHRQKDIEKARAKYAEHIDDMRSGEFKWIVNPARAYLGMLRDLQTDGAPSDNIAEWLGDEIRDAALIGFEAVLHRSDLPPTKQIAEDYAADRCWNFVFPMLAGAGQRYLDRHGFGDLPDELVYSLAIAAEHESSSVKEHLDGLQEDLDARLRTNPKTYEAYLRQKFEPMLAAKRRHLPGLYQFARQDIERPLSTRLSLEWLERFPGLPLDVERQLTDCIIDTTKTDRDDAWPALGAIAGQRLADLETDSDAEMLWRSLQFLLDFENAIVRIPTITPENRNWLWSLTNSFYERYEREKRVAIISTCQLKWIVAKFRIVWPHTKRPNGLRMGDTNPWDATELLERTIYRIAKDPSDEAAQALAVLRDMPRDGYTVITQSAIADNHRAQIEARFKSPSLPELKTVLADQPPQSAADVQSIIVDELSELQARLYGDPLNLFNNFYDDSGQPRTENECRDQMLIALGKLPFGIQIPPEEAMPQGKRSDAALVYGDIAVPLEAKGQWHRKVWTAASTQLDRYYTVAYKSASKGIYVVFWFGHEASAGKRLKRPPNRAPKPQTAEDMRLALQALIPTERRSDIAIVVLDLTQP